MSRNVSMLTVMRRASACLTALVRASSSSRMIWITCQGRNSGCTGRPGGVITPIELDVVRAQLRHRALAP